MPSRSKALILMVCTMTIVGCREIRDPFPDIVAIKKVKALHNAETAFFKAHNRYGSIDELAVGAEGPYQLRTSGGHDYSYRYSIELTREGYVIRAWAERGQHAAALRSFCTNESGTIQEYATSGPPDCGPGGREVR